MKKTGIILIIVAVTSSFCFKTDRQHYTDLYTSFLTEFDKQQISLLSIIKTSDLNAETDRAKVKSAIAAARLKLKSADFWLRYFEPIAYKKLNGPLPVEWENEVFEKFEKPYRREGSGLTLAELYLDEKNIAGDSLAHLIELAIKAVNTFRADSITEQLGRPDHFFLCNRLYLLNLAAIYTTGFECPETENIIPELCAMMTDVKAIYSGYNQTFPATALTNDYLLLYDKAVDFAAHQPKDFTQFDHYTFIKDHINPLFAINQKLIRNYGVVSTSFNDYTLNNNSNSIFDKSLYTPQNTKGIYSLVTDKAVLSEIRKTGKLLFYDPILSGNNARSCASCHKPKEYFTDTSVASALHFDKQQRLTRNTPTLINVIYNHLLMLDGKHISLQNQGKDVVQNSIEMGGSEKGILEKVLSCKEYKTAFKKFLKYTPEEHEVTLDHIISAITFYYRDFSNYYSPFDNAMNHGDIPDKESVRGFNLFMSKAQCATCHFVPQFNGVHPPYIGSEFEVIGVPADKNHSKVSEDKGRNEINPAFETMNAFRTGSIRNTEHTKPYMHNGVFNTMDEVIDFYDAGGGAGRKLNVINQTLSADSLHLTNVEKKALISFIHSLNENIVFEDAPETLPASSNKALNSRKPGGEY